MTHSLESPRQPNPTTPPPIDSCSTKSSCSWERDKIPTKFGMTINTSVVDKRVDAEWFNRIYSPRGWLCNDNLDALINLVMYKAKMWRGCFLDRWTCVELAFWNSLTANRLWNKWLNAYKSRTQWSWSKENRFVMRCANGRYPCGLGVPWANVDHVYGVAHVFTNHWVLYQVVLREEMILIYDSMSDDHHTVNYSSSFTRLAVLLPDICFETRIRLKTTNPFKVRVCSRAPQQLNTSDCGIMAIKFLECLVSGSPLDIINPAVTREYRLRFCCELYKKQNITL